MQVKVAESVVGDGSELLVEDDAAELRVLEVEGSRIEKLEVEFVGPVVEEPERPEQRAAAEG